MKITVELEPVQAATLLRFMRRLLESDAQHTLGSNADLFQFKLAQDQLCLALSTALTTWSGAR
jgi:hypothetical protein